MADVKIDIPGLGEVKADNAASESTLRELVKKLGDAGVIAKDNASKQKKYTKAKEEATKKTNVFTGALGDAASSLVNFSASLVAGTIGAVTGLAKELVAGGNQLSDFTKYLPIPGLSALSGLLDNQVNQFRDLSQTGASFSNNMFEMAVVAGRAAIPQQDFIDLLKENSLGLRNFGNTVGDGARNFAGIAKTFRQSNVGKDLMNMGFTTEELNENLISYNEMMLVTGQRERMSQAQLLEGTAKYSKELDAIAKLTGKSRKQVEEEMKQKNLDIRRQMAIAKHGAQFASSLELAAAASPKLEAALLDASDGIANDPLTRQLMATNEAFRDNAQNIGKMSADEMQNFIADVKEGGVNFANTLKDSGTQAAIAQGGPVGESLMLFGELGRVQKTNLGSLQAEQAARDQVTSNMALLAETINDTRGALQADIIGSDLFKDMMETTTNLIPSIDEAREMYGTASDYFKNNILPVLGDTWEWLKTDGYNMMVDSFTAIKDYATGLIGAYKEGGLGGLWDKFSEGAFGWIEDWWAGLSNEEIIAGLIAGFAAVALGPVGLIGGAIVAGITATFGWDKLKPYFVEAFGDFDLEEMAKEAWQNIKNWFAGIFEDLLDFKFEMPDFTAYLPKWLGGEGKSIFGDDYAEAPPKPSSAVQESMASGDALPAVQESTPTTVTASTDGAQDLNQLNTSMLTLLDLTKKNTAAIKSLNGNLMVG